MTRTPSPWARSQALALLIAALVCHGVLACQVGPGGDHAGHEAPAMGSMTHVAATMAVVSGEIAHHHDGSLLAAMLVAPVLLLLLLFAIRAARRALGQPAPHPLRTRVLPRGPPPARPRRLLLCISRT